jgi:hypothetical protein
VSDSSEERVYRVVGVAGKFEVLSATGTCVMVFLDSASAEHYAVMLSQAYREGYKQAVRDNR